MTIAQLISVLRGRWMAIAGSTLAFVLLALTASLVLSKKYTATAAMLIDSRGIDALGNPNDRMQISNQTLVTTQTDVIKSERVARRVVAVLKLDEDAEFRRIWQAETDGQGDAASYIAQILLRQLEVQPTRDSNVVNLAYKSKDAQRSTNIVNAVAKAYVDTNLELKTEPSRQYAGWFDERTRTLRGQLDTAQSRLAAFQRDNGLIVTTNAGGASQTDIETNKLSQLTGQLLEVQATRVDTSSRQAQASRDASTSPDVTATPLISDLRGRINEARAKLEQLRSQFGERHPQVVAARDELATMDRQLRAELDSAARTVAASNAVNRQREAELREAAQAQRERVLALSKATNQLGVLQKDVENAQRALDDAMQRQSQAALQSQLQQVNVMLLTPASVPALPSSPRLGLNLAIGLILGAIAGLALALVRELRAPTVRSVDDLALAVELPVLGVVRNARLAAPAAARRLTFKRATA